MTNYYSLLGVPPTATTDEIKKAYRQLALKYHPDRNPGDIKSESFFKKVTEAYNTLSDPEEREKYDYQYKKNQQTSNSRSEQNKQGEPKREITPQTILFATQELRKKIISEQISQFTLFKSLDNLLSNIKVSLLLACGDTTINNKIIAEAMTCCSSLDYVLLEKILPKLAKLAGSDNETIRKIYSFDRKQKLRSYWDRYKGAAIIAAIILLIILFVNLIDGSSSTSSKANNNHENGDLDRSFLNNNSTTPSSKTSSLPIYASESTPEQKSQQEKDRLLADGWKETDVKNGQLPSCYNFLPKKTSIDNYLEVHVGGGTDVVIKLMNSKTEKCIRYVFINSGTTYKIRNIPQGIYYLKIAYGTDWFSKAENGRCIGKFLRNPMYEKGDELLDYNFKYTSDGYNIPSFQLKLDVVASATMNTFSSEDISESEFNQ